MLNKNSTLSRLHQLKIPTVGLLFTLAIVGEQATPVLSHQILAASNSQAIAANLPNQTADIFSNSPKTAKNLGISQKANLPTKDGIYLYGQTPQPNQLGQGYVVFHKQQGKVVGALYMPSSEFSCFRGTLNKSGELAMTVTTTPDAGISSDVATTSKIPTFSGDEEPVNYAHSLTLKDYHQIQSISSNDRRLLQMCSQSATGQ